MLPALQSSRPKPPQQNPRPIYAHQQKRATHELPRSPPFQSSKEPSNPTNELKFPKPRNQIEAMPPFNTAQAPLFPPRNSYDSAVRHPVFFTAQLRKPPFPIPEMASHGWNPVANGYIMEARKAEGNGIPKTKL